MACFLAIQSTYEAIECAVFFEDALVRRCTVDKLAASSALIHSLELLLAQSEQSLSSLDFAIVNLGPAPFTTLRVVIATMNGIQFATGMPLVGVGCFEAGFDQLKAPDSDVAIMMNAFGNEVYLAIRRAGESNYTASILPVEYALEMLVALKSTKLLVAGNGTLMHRDALEKRLSAKLIFAEPGRSMNSLESLAKVGLEKWYRDEGQRTPLAPHYLRTITV